jgi:hypothetical protein
MGRRPSVFILANFASRRFEVTHEERVMLPTVGLPQGEASDPDGPEALIQASSDCADAPDSLEVQFRRLVVDPDHLDLPVEVRRRAKKVIPPRVLVAPCRMSHAISRVRPLQRLVPRPGKS